MLIILQKVKNLWCAISTFPKLEESRCKRRAHEMPQKCVTTGTLFCWSREWWKDVCLFLASRGHSLTVKSLKSDKQSPFLLQYIIYKTLQSFKQPNLRSQFWEHEKKLCLAFTALYNPWAGRRTGVCSNASASASCTGPIRDPWCWDDRSG